MSVRADMQEEKERTEKIILRMKQVCSVKTDTELAEVLGISANNIFGWRRRKSVPDREIFSVSEKFRIRSRWLTLGELPMKESGTPDAEVIELTEEEKKMIEVLEMFGIKTAEELEIALEGIEEAKKLREQGIDVVVTEFAEYLATKKKSETK